MDANDERQPSGWAQSPVYTPVPGGPGPFGPYPSPPLEPAPPAPPTHRWGLGAYIVAEIVFLGVSTLLALTLLVELPPQAWELAVALGVPSVAAALVGVLITIVRGNGPFVDLRLRFTWREFGLGLAFGFGGLFLTLPATFVYASIVGDEATSAVGDVFGGVLATPAVALLVAALVVLVVPLCEEILYRGLLWRGVSRLGANVWVTFAVVTLIFALAHFEWPRALLLIVVSVPIGLARVYTDGLLAPIIAHQANNLIPGIALYLTLTGALPAMV